MSGSALILAGHGSHIRADTAGVVWAYVDRLRGWGVADEIAACFWKEAPAFAHVLDTVASDDIVIVPVFTARGYFTGEVIPTELGVGEGLTRRRGKRIRLTPPIGEHPRLQSIVERRLKATVERHSLPPADTAAAIIGHGTRRNRNSRDTARQQADRIRDLRWLREVVDVYLDDEPDIPSVYRRTSAANIIALPYFLARGSHVRLDVPRALGIEDLNSVNRVRSRSVYYCEPVGTDESICRAILDLARDTGLPFAKRDVAGAWSGFPRAGETVLLDALKSEKILRFGQVLVDSRRAWHGENGATSKSIASPAALRTFTREKPFRPLATSADLPAGWHVDLDEPTDAHSVIETIYPGLIADWAANQRGDLKTESLTDIGRRQSGMFKDIQLLPQRVVKATIGKVCGNCVRQPIWQLGLGERGSLPCRSACNLWLSSARRMGEASA